MSRAALLTAVGLCLVACGPVARDAAARARTRAAELRHQGIDRTYRVHTPPALPAAPDLVVVLHGGGGSGEQIEEVTGFSGIADREGFVVVYPDAIANAPRGFARFWSDGHCCGVAVARGIDDVSFLRRLIDEVGGRYRTARTFVVGWSNGGMLAFAAGARLSDLVSGIAVFGATMHGRPPWRAPRFDVPWPTRPVAVLAAHGTHDTRVPYEGREDASGVEIPVRQAARFWAVAAKCRARPVRYLERGGVVERESYEGCQAPVAVLTLRGWGHDWPGPAYTDDLGANHPLHGFDLAQEIRAFFARR